MLKGCTKFRLFNLLILFGVVNILVFRTYFRKESGLKLSSRGCDVNTTSSQANAKADVNANPTSASVVTLLSSQRLVTTRALSHSDPKSTNATAAAGNPTEGRGQKWRDGGRVLEAWGKRVRPRANVTAPWGLGNSSSPLCPPVPPKLVGPLQTYTQAPRWTDIVGLNPGLEVGGHYQPAQCRARHRVAVVVPYRDREKHLQLLLHNLHPMLIRQQLDYFVLVVELAQPTKFNRGLLLNIGAVEALGLRDVHCFVFHDVDLVPENDRNLYTCPYNPRHMSAAVDKFKYRLPYKDILGGAMAITGEHFYKVNGYSNMYFGWGGEDDDLYERVKTAGLKITRYSMDIARYRMMKHERDKDNEPNPNRFGMLKSFHQRQPRDGLNSLQYQVDRVEFRPAYTWILVSVDQDKVMKS